MPKRKTKRPPKRRQRPPVQVPDELKAFAISGTAELSAAKDDSDDADPMCKSFRMTAYTGGIMRPHLSGGYTGKGVVLDLAGWRFQRGQSAVNWQHDRSEPVGHIESSQIDNRVVVAGLLSQPCDKRDRIVSADRNGYKWRVSVEGTPDFSKAEQISATETIQANGRRIKGPFLFLRAGEFTGVGFVTNAGDQGATASIAAQLDGTESMDPTFEEFLEACGVDPTKATKEQRAALQAAYDAQYGTPSGEGDENEEIEADEDEGGTLTAQQGRRRPNNQSTVRTQRDEGTEVSRPTAEEVLNAENKARAENARRCKTISRLCAAADGIEEFEIDGKKVEDLESYAIENNLSASEVELTIYRNSAPRGPAIQAKGGNDELTKQAIVGAVLLEAGVPLDSESYRDPAARSMGVPQFLQADLNSDHRGRVLDAAHEYGDVSMLGMAADCLRMEGKVVPRNREDLIRAAASSANLTDVFQHTIGASLLLGYREAPRTLESWTGTDEVLNFNEEQRHTEDIGETLDHLPQDGEAEHTTFGAKYETVSIDSYAKQAEIGRHHYINDNLGILAKKPRQMGKMAYRTEENLGYAVLLSNPTMKSTGRQLFNSTDGTDYGSTPLNHDNASTLIAAMSSQTEGDAVLDLMAKHALVPPELLDTARQVYRSAFIGEDNGQGTVNPIAEHGVMPKGCPRLGVGVRHPKTKAFHGGSATTHYLLAESIEIAVRIYLRGSKRRPMVRVSQLTQGRWGTHIDIVHEVGFAFMTTKGIFRARSEA